jgi:cytochrome c oxidase assembly factor CtaG
MRAASLAVLCALYAAGVIRLWRTAGCGRGIRPFEAGAFAIGWVTLAVALSPVLDRWSDASLAAHMVQHELLMVVAAPTIALGAPMIAMLWAMPPGLRQRAIGLVRRQPLTGAWSMITAPASVFFLYAAAVWGWHIPALYDAALEHEGVHALEHFCFFSTATLFWWGIAHGRHGRLGYGAAVVYVFATAVQAGLLGALLTISPRVWYAPYASPHPTGLSPLEDQQLAGLLMWVPAGIATAAGGLTLFAAWLRQSDRSSRFKTPVLRPGQIR